MPYLNRLSLEIKINVLNTAVTFYRMVYKM